VEQRLLPSPNLSPLGRGNAEQRLLPSPNLSPLGRGNGEGAIFIKFKIEKVNIISYAIKKYLDF
jgi:hypothetical protein